MSVWAFQAGSPKNKLRCPITLGPNMASTAVSIRRLFARGLRFSATPASSGKVTIRSGISPPSGFRLASYQAAICWEASSESWRTYVAETIVLPSKPMDDPLRRPQCGWVLETIGRVARPGRWLQTAVATHQPDKRHSTWRPGAN